MVDLGSTGSIVDKKKKKRLDIYTRRLCGLNAVFQTQTSCSTTWVQQQDENNYHEWVFHICGCAGVLPMSYTYFTKTLVVTVGFQKFHIEKLISTAHTRASSVWILIFFSFVFHVLRVCWFDVRFTVKISTCLLFLFSCLWPRETGQNITAAGSKQNPASTLL